MRSPWTSRARVGEAAGQRLADLGGIGAGAPGEGQGLGDGLDGQADDDLVGDLGGLAVAVRADVGDGLAHGVEEGLGLGEGLRRAADHDGQRRVLCTDLAA
jgi:hypothetical protein